MGWFGERKGGRPVKFKGGCSEFPPSSLVDALLFPMRRGFFSWRRARGGRGGGLRCRREVAGVELYQVWRHGWSDTALIKSVALRGGAAPGLKCHPRGGERGVGMLCRAEQFTLDGFLIIAPGSSLVSFRSAL